MYLSDIATSSSHDLSHDLKGARVLITGLTVASGVDVSRAFADLGCRLVIHTNELSPELTALVALLSQSAAEMKLYTNDLTEAGCTVAFAQSAAQAYGGFDAVINLSTLTAGDMAGAESDSAVDELITVKLSPLVHLTRVIANRMRLVLSQGLILNVLATAHPSNRREAAIASIARSTLAAMTAQEARSWAAEGIRINAVGPRAMYDGRPNAGACLCNEPELAVLGLHLASRRGRGLSGHVFDADGIA